MSFIEFSQEGPPPTRKPSRLSEESLVEWSSILLQLQHRPGTWAKVAVMPKRKGSLAAWLRKRGCEVTERTGAADKMVTVWARWPAI